MQNTVKRSVIMIFAMSEGPFRSFGENGSWFAVYEEQNKVVHGMFDSLQLTFPCAIMNLRFTL